jgi:hypothetical protein
LENNPISIHPCVNPCRSNNRENDDTNIDDALAVNPNLKRQDLKMTAVLAVAPVALEAQSATPISTISIETNVNIATKATAKLARDGGGAIIKSGTLSNVTPHVAMLQRRLNIQLWWMVLGRVAFIRGPISFSLHINHYIISDVHRILRTILISI